MYNNQNSIANPPAFLKTITIIHGALLIGQLIFAVVAFAITNNPAINLKPGNDPVFYIAPVMTVFGMLAGSILFKKLLATVPGKNSLAEKLGVYQTALIIRYALSEGASLFSIVGYLLSGNLFYLLITAFNILYFVWIRPTNIKVEDDLNLSYEEKQAMNLDRVA